MDSTNRRRTIFQGLIRQGMTAETAADLIEEWDQEAARHGLRPGPDYWRKGVEWMTKQRATGEDGTSSSR